MKLKVCGMRDKVNIEQVAELGIDYMGFIFYEGSKRFVGDLLEVDCLSKLPTGMKKVGVFVNAPISEVIKLANKYGLDFVQLHGEETPQYVAELFALHISVIKAFAIDEKFDFKSISSYHPFADYFLFDTKGEQKGGTGKKFNWALLKNYDQKIPFFLSGGIDLGDIEEIQGLNHLNIHAIDVNSKFEMAPGLKNIDRIAQLVEKMN